MISGGCNLYVFKNLFVYGEVELKKGYFLGYISNSVSEGGLVLVFV